MADECTEIFSHDAGALEPRSPQVGDKAHECTVIFSHEEAGVLEPCSPQIGDDELEWLYAGCWTDMEALRGSMPVRLKRRRWEAGRVGAASPASDSCARASADASGVIGACGTNSVWLGTQARARKQQRVSIPCC